MDMLARISVKGIFVVLVGAARMDTLDALLMGVILSGFSHVYMKWTRWNSYLNRSSGAMCLKT